jgi:predicted metal-dependent peptidase
MQDLEASPPDKDVAGEVADILVRAQLQSKMAGDAAGTIPGEIQLFLDNLLDPKLPWQTILRKYLQTFAKNDYTFRRPNRRYFPTHLLPSLYSQALLTIDVAVDISGSVTDDEFKRFVSETASILRMMKPEKIRIVQFDTRIQSVDTVKNLHQLMQINFTGRGGTLIEPVLEWADANKPQLLLVFTDGCFRFHRQTSKTDVLWLIHDNPGFTAPFGKTLHYAM